MLVLVLFVVLVLVSALVWLLVMVGVILELVFVLMLALRIMCGVIGTSIISRSSSRGSGGDGHIGTSISNSRSRCNNSCIDNVRNPKSSIIKATSSSVVCSH